MNATPKIVRLVLKFWRLEPALTSNQILMTRLGAQAVLPTETSMTRAKLKS